MNHFKKANTHVTGTGFMTSVCGYIHFTSIWFDGDDVREPTTTTPITVYAQNGVIVKNLQLRQLWKCAIKSKYYVDHKPDVFTFLDFKSNPRRIHPFAKAFVKWYCYEIPSYIRGERAHPPILILWPTTLRLEGYWRDGLSHDMCNIARMRMVTNLSAQRALRKLQMWWRSRSTLRVCRLECKY